MTVIEIIKGDITVLAVDAIVNSANDDLLGGHGVDGAIHKAAGWGLFDECNTLGGCKTGEAKITGGYNLPARHVIHTVGPIWYGGEKGEAELLATCYKNCIEVALENGCKSIAFPAISTGVFGYPLEAATRVAIPAVRESVAGTALEKVILVCFDEQAYRTYLSIFQESEMQR